MDALEKARKVIRIEIAELEALAQRVDEHFDNAIEALRKGLDKGRKIIVVGVGKSGDVGHKIAATFNSTGAATVVLSSQNALHGDLGLVNSGDIVLALSQSGETRELIDLLPHLCRRGALIVGITGGGNTCTLGQNSDILLDTRVNREACPLNLAPTSSTTVMLVLGDALAMVLLEARGFRAEDFAELHPGGQLGRILLTRVRDVMRSGERLATVIPETLIQETLARMTQCRAGAAVVTDVEGKMAGIFTHGDFVRAYQKDHGVGVRRVGDFMSRNPVAISAGKLATEALHLLEAHRVDDLVVIDDAGRPTGIIDTQDLSRMHLV